MKPKIHYNDLPKDLNFKNQVSIDTEAMGLHFPRDRLCVVQIADEKGQVHIIHFNDENAKRPFKAPNLCKLLKDKKVTKIFHFARFDLGIMKYYLKTEIHNIYCTKIASRMSRTYTNHHSLKALCSELLGHAIDKKQQSSDWGSDKLNEKQIEYAAGDVIHLIEIKAILTKMLKRENRYALFEKCLSALETIVELDNIQWPMENIFNHQTLN